MVDHSKEYSCNKYPSEYNTQQPRIVWFVKKYLTRNSSQHFQQTQNNSQDAPQSTSHPSSNNADKDRERIILDLITQIPKVVLVELPRIKQQPRILNVIIVERALFNKFP